MSDEVDQAIARARSHVANASQEAAAAIAAILEAAGSASGLDPAQTERLTADVAARFEEQLKHLRAGALFPAALAGPLQEALAREIARWEERSRKDPDARPVLRAFLGLRELIWELGLRTDRETDESPSPSAGEAPPPSPAKPRVQRFDVED